MIADGHAQPYNYDLPLFSVCHSAMHQQTNFLMHSLKGTNAEGGIGATVYSISSHPEQYYVIASDGYLFSRTNIY